MATLSEAFTSNPPFLGITSGDPAGIGPEISLRAVVDRRVAPLCRPVLYGDAEILRAIAGRLGLPFEFTVTSTDRLADAKGASPPLLVHIPASRAEIRSGEGSRASGEAAARNVIECARACKAGLLAGMVTAPLNKRYLREAGYPFPGHTEMLADIAGVSAVAMAFLTDTLKVVLATIHVPLREAIEQVTADKILEKIDITVREFPRLGLRCRRLAIAGLNPHAGEDGLLGTEESEHIRPAVEAARGTHTNVVIEGPIPGDTVFHRAAQGEFDVVLALFHDQGLAPIKLLAFGEAVNVTLGLPFVRTSVDHGTAFDIAGKGIARSDSMVSAILWAVRLIGSH